ncbi:unnamed protein product [Caenorhabditis angaria]|uniref:Nuclear receptor domain-containing protein n=1 Tax=Caenorhabditis angaria TaxID=860376 RepID=A0A9P1IUF7_9PELO|nr:unnamed protein product [Caenorhabditis angaria]
MQSHNKCSVCSEDSFGKHYGINTCMGCKSFFIRSTKRTVTYSKCPFNQNCYSTVVSHYKCRECRFKKCLEVGMNMENKQITGWEIWKELESPHTQINSLLRILSHVDLKIEKLRASTFNPIIYPGLQEMISDSSKSYLGKTFEPMPGWPLTKSKTVEMNKKLNERRVDIEVRKEFQVEQSEFIDSKEFNVKEWIIFDSLMVIEYAKTFPFFYKLLERDKCVLIRETHYMISLITSNFQSYLNKKDALQTPDGFFYDGNLTTGQVARFSLGPVMAYVLTTKANMRPTKTDLEMVMAADLPDDIPLATLGFLTMEPYSRNKFTKEEYLMMKAFTFCNPVDNLSPFGKQIVQKEQQKYAIIILNHCLTIRNDPSRFITIIEHVNFLSRSQKKYKDFITFMKTVAKSRASNSRRELEDQLFSY